MVRKICVMCGIFITHYAHSLCSSCYSKHRYYTNDKIRNRILLGGRDYRRRMKAKKLEEDYTMLPHKCFKCNSELWISGDKKNYSYHKGVYYCWECFKKGGRTNE